MHTQAPAPSHRQRFMTGDVLAEVEETLEEAKRHIMEMTLEFNAHMNRAGYVVEAAHKVYKPRVARIELLLTIIREMNRG